MRLNPKLPPGRANRKALQFAADIHQLRHAGYAAKALKSAGLPLNLDIKTGPLIPLVLAGVWHLSRRIHHRLLPGGQQPLSAIGTGGRLPGCPAH